ncbi:hypothetical protein DM860_000384 [Cuscuta australis]|uniref:Uncharacterized protein n=1 Tax=Cuscuta australis TaxID=267555 RepID=A0A328CYE4_9ASTE|nr:hypothetical protein DM860_000384 [Cuscuta australis]
MTWDVEDPYDQISNVPEILLYSLMDVILKTKHVSDLGRVGRCYVYPVFQDLWDIGNLIVAVLNIPGHPISLSVTGSLGNFIDILNSSGFNDARIILDNPLFYNTLQGLNLHEKLHIALFDKKVYGQVQVDHVIWNSAGYYLMLMTWVQKTNNSMLHGVRTTGYVPRCDVIRHLKNTL